MDESGVTKFSNNNNVVNIIMFNSPENQTIDGRAKDEILANEVGDVMFLINYPEMVLDDGKNAKKGFGYRSLDGTHYSEQVQKIYTLKKDKKYESSNAYPLIYINKNKSKTQDGKTIKD